MARISKYQKKIESQDPNKVYKLSCKLKCTTVNDYVNWDNLHGKVKTFKLTKDQINKYLEGEFEI